MPSPKPRNAKIGFVFQGFNLLAPHEPPSRTWSCPLLYTGLPARERHERAQASWWPSAGRSGRPSPLATLGRQQQRVASPRALVNESGLDPGPTSRRVISIRVPASKSWPLQDSIGRGIHGRLATHEATSCLSRRAHHVPRRSGAQNDEGDGDRDAGVLHLPARGRGRGVKTSSRAPASPFAPAREQAPQHPTMSASSWRGGGHRHDLGRLGGAGAHRRADPEPGASMLVVLSAPARRAGCAWGGLPSSHSPRRCLAIKRRIRVSRPPLPPCALGSGGLGNLNWVRPVQGHHARFARRGWPVVAGSSFAQEACGRRHQGGRAGRDGRAQSLRRLGSRRQVIRIKKVPFTVVGISEEGQTTWARTRTTSSCRP